MLIYTSIHFLHQLNPIQDSQEGWSLCQLSLGERQGTPRTHRQSITRPRRDNRDKQPSTLTLTSTVNLESPISLTFIFLDGGRKPEYPGREHTHTRGEHANSTRKDLSQDSNQEPSSWELTMLTTTPPCSPNY